MKNNRKQKVSERIRANRKLQRMFTLYVDSTIFHFNNLTFFVCSYCCKLFLIKDFLLTSSSDESVACVAPCADVTCVAPCADDHTHICSNNVKNVITN